MRIYRRRITKSSSIGIIVVVVVVVLLIRGHCHQLFWRQRKPWVINTFIRGRTLIRVPEKQIAWWNRR